MCIELLIIIRSFFFLAGWCIPSGIWWCFEIQSRSSWCWGFGAASWWVCGTWMVLFFHYLSTFLCSYESRLNTTWFDSQVCELREGIGCATNNVAEYRAFILGLRGALDRGIYRVRVQGDSKLVCEQVCFIFSGLVQIPSSVNNLKPYFHESNVQFISWPTHATFVFVDTNMINWPEHQSSGF